MEIPTWKEQLRATVQGFQAFNTTDVSFFVIYDFGLASFQPAPNYGMLVEDCLVSSL